MKTLPSLVHVCGVIVIFAFTARDGLTETRTFTSNDGRTIEAEVTAVAGGDVSLSLASGKTFVLPVTRFSDEDQAFLRGWAAENKSAVPRSAIRLEIKKRSSKIRNERKEGEEKKKYKERVEREGIKNQTIYSLNLRNTTRQPVPDVSVAYKIFKRVSMRGFGELDGSGTEETLGTKDVGDIDPSALEEIGLDPFITTDTYQKGKDRNPDKRQNETLIGIVVKVSAGGKELYKQSFPANLIARMQQEFERNQSKAAQDAARDARRDSQEEEKEARREEREARREAKEEEERKKKEGKKKEGKEKEKEKEKEKAGAG